MLTEATSRLTRTREPDLERPRAPDLPRGWVVVADMSAAVVKRERASASRRITFRSLHHTVSCSVPPDVVYCL